MEFKNKINQIPKESYKLEHYNKFKKVDKSLYDIADKIDINKDRKLQDEEIIKFLSKTDILRDKTKFEVNEEKILNDYKNFLRNIKPEYTNGYNSYSDVVTKLNDLQIKYPEIAKVIKLGSSPEGRDILALRISNDSVKEGASSSKPGIVFTGLHHAREWISLEVPLYLAQNMVKNYETDPEMKKRIDSSETWIIPIVNPDGYEYSRKKNSFWRKNRRPVKIDACGKKTNAIGTDLNRNYYDGNPNHLVYYRPKSDTPCSTTDDYGATSDNPFNDTYRGSFGSSEQEIQALLNLELKNKNIKGIIDYHSYGNVMLYPWGIKEEHVPNYDKYMNISEGMQKAMRKPLRTAQSVEMYPASGSSEDVHQLNNIISLTIELGDSFQPSASQIKPICENLFPANLYFIDRMIDKS